MPIINDLIPVGNTFTSGTTYNFATGTLNNVVDNVSTVYNDIYHGDTLDFGGFTADIVSSRYIEVSYYDESGTVIGSNGPAYHVSFDNGESYLFISDTNPHKDLQDVRSIEITSVDTNSNIHTMLVSEFDGNDTMEVVCFVAGTAILTDIGQRSIEDLKIGDLVWTMDHGFQPIHQIAQTTVPTRVMARNVKTRPIVFLPNSLGEGCPQTTIRVSQQHKILLNGPDIERYFGMKEVFAKAKHLCNGHDIYMDLPHEDITYCHIDFAGHEVVSTSGLFSESLFDRSLKAVNRAQKETEIMRYFSEGQERRPARHTLSGGDIRAYKAIMGAPDLPKLISA